MRMPHCLKTYKHFRLAKMVTSEASIALRKRFEKHKEKYGTLWREMAKETGIKDQKKFSFIDVIESKQTVLVSAHECDARGCLGDCNEEDESRAVLIDISDKNNRPGFLVREIASTSTSKSGCQGENSRVIDLVSEDDNSTRNINGDQNAVAEYVGSSSEEYEFSSQVEAQSVVSDTSDSNFSGQGDDDSHASFIDDSTVSSESFLTCEQGDSDSDKKPPLTTLHPYTPRKRYTSATTPSSCNVTRRSFLKQRDELTAATFEEFDNKVFDGALRTVLVSWSKRLLKTAGLTYLKQLKNSKTTNRTAHIELSCKVVDNKHRLRSTLLHEMCHAAAWLIDSVSSPPHGSCFQKWANFAMHKIPDVEVTTKHNYEINYKYAWACTQCGNLIRRQSRSVDVIRHCCSRCRGTLEEIEVPAAGSKIYTPKKKRAPSAFGAYVKQHSQGVRAKLLLEMPSVSQSQVMAECGRLWKLEKALNVGNDDALVEKLHGMAIHNRED